MSDAEHEAAEKRRLFWIVVFAIYGLAVLGGLIWYNL
jgi:hypothetical protein